MKLAPWLREAWLHQSVIADGVTVRRTATGDAFDSRHHLQFAVVGRKFCKEVCDDCEEVFCSGVNRLHATIRASGDARRMSMFCSFTADRFNVGPEFRMHR